MAKTVPLIKEGIVVIGTTTLSGRGTLPGSSDEDTGHVNTLESYKNYDTVQLMATTVDQTHTFDQPVDMIFVHRNITDGNLLYTEPDAAVDNNSVPIYVGGTHMIPKRGTQNLHYQCSNAPVTSSVFHLSFGWN